MEAHRDADTIEPLMNTWRWFKDGATWYWVPRSRPDSAEARDLNPWSATQLTEVLAAFHHIARVRTASFNTPPGSPSPATDEWRWNPGKTSHAEFERKLVTAVRTEPHPLSSATLVLDLNVWVRTASRKSPLRGWVPNAAHIQMLFEKDSPYGALSLEHTLFMDGATYDDSNAELHRLNQPLLQETLAAIEARVGSISEVEGRLPGITRTGFQSIT